MSEKGKPLGQVTLFNCRLSFAALDKPPKDKINEKTGETIVGKYKGNLLFTKGTKATKRNLAAIKAAADEVKEAKWGEVPPKFKPERLCLRDGDLEDWDGYEGCYYVSANNNNKPITVGKNPRRVVAPGDAEWPYSGCYVNAIIRVWAMDNKPEDGGKRINASIESVQFLTDGERFSGSAPVNPEEEFEDISDDGGPSEEFPDEEEEERPRGKSKGKAKPRLDPEEYEDEDESLI